MKRLRILTIIALVLAIVVFTIKNQTPSTIPAGKGLLVNKAWMTTSPRSLTPQKDIRPPDQTFLTYPEWFLVFSPDEQAGYFKTHTSTQFPYLKHIDQFWKGYDVVYHQLKGNYKFNTGYHVMIMVIGVSTTVEYGAKSFYETIIGRITDTKPGQQLTDEDQFNAAYMAGYVSFIKDSPWYEFDFNHQLKELWANTSLFGPDMLRKWERKYYLTTELMVKSGYGWLIKLGTQSAYDTALLNTAVIVDKLPTDMNNFPEIKNIRQLPGGAVSIDLPRYAKFNPAACKLAASGIHFKEIAGNKGAIMLTVLTSRKLIADTDIKVLFTQPIETYPGLNRVAFVTTVSDLNTTVKKLLDSKTVIEHIYDY